MKFCTRVRLKPSNDRCEFELDQARSKNNIAENSIALGHDTHNKYFVSRPGTEPVTLVPQAGTQLATEPPRACTATYLATGNIDNSQFADYVFILHFLRSP